MIFQSAHSYEEGDVAIPCDVHHETDQAVNHALASRLRDGDAAFIKRSDGRWKYAIVSHQYCCDYPYIEFKVDNIGSKKKLLKESWGVAIRRVVRKCRRGCDPVPSTIETSHPKSPRNERDTRHISSPCHPSVDRKSRHQMEPKEEQFEVKSRRPSSKLRRQHCSSLDGSFKKVKHTSGTQEAVKTRSQLAGGEIERRHIQSCAVSESIPAVLPSGVDDFKDDGHVQREISYSEMTSNERDTSQTNAPRHQSFGGRRHRQKEPEQECLEIKNVKHIVRMKKVIKTRDRSPVIEKKTDAKRDNKSGSSSKDFELQEIPRKDSPATEDMESRIQKLFRHVMTSNDQRLLKEVITDSTSGLSKDFELEEIPRKDWPATEDMEIRIQHLFRDVMTSDEFLVAF